MRFLTRAIPTLMAVLVAAASFALSYVAFRDVAADTAAVPAHLAWLTPICVDGAVLAGSASLWASSMRGTRKDPVAVLTVVSLLAVSVVVNTSHAGPSVLAKVIAALPPITLLACLELVAGQYRRDALDARAEAPTQAGPAVGDTPAGPVEASPARVQSSAAGAGPTLPAPVAEPSAPPSAPAVSVPTPVPAQVDARPDGNDPAPVTRSETAVPLTRQVPARRSVEGVEGQAAPGVPAPAAGEATPGPRPASAGAAAGPVAALPGRPGAGERRESSAARVTSRAGDRPARPAAVQPTRSGAAPEDGADAASTGARVAELFAAHLAAGGSPTDPSLSRTFAERLELSPAYVRKHLAPLRRMDEPAA